MISSWTKHLKDPEQKALFQNRLLGSKDIFDRLTELLEEKEQDLDRSELSLEAYTNPSWAYQQAHKNGLRQAFNMVKNILNTDPKDNK